MKRNTYILLFNILILMLFYVEIYNVGYLFGWLLILSFAVLMGIRNRTIGYPFFLWRWKDVKESFFKRFSEP